MYLVSVRRAGERCERPGARAGAARGAGGRRRWRRGRQRGRSERAAALGTGARGLIRQTLPPVETAVGSYRRIIRR